MEYCLSIHNNKPYVLDSLPSPVKILNFSLSSRRFFKSPRSVNVSRDRRVLVVAAASASSSSSSSHCEYNNSLNTPLEPRSAAGKFLSGVLQNDRLCFHGAVAGELERLVVDREDAFARKVLSADTDEACLHRRIAELKDQECRNAVEDVMYMLIFYKFSEIKVHLIPQISKCIYNGRLEILPSKDWELESIHSFEVLEMIRGHLTSVVGWRADSNVTDNWATTKIKRLHLFRIYTASILYGYFLKSATLRHQLEMSLADATNEDLVLNSGTRSPLSELWNHGLKKISFGRIGRADCMPLGQAQCSESRKREKLSSYLMRFDPESLEKCTKPHSKEALRLIEKHTHALFADKLGLLESDEVISTSLASLKRFVLEAVAFGSFLYDTEEYVKTVYNLEEN